MQRVNIDLATARAIPVAFSIMNAKRLRFHVVPSPCEVRIQASSNDPIPVNEAFTLENCSPDPWTKIWITNAAGSGFLVVLATDGSEDFDDFLGGSGFPSGPSQSATLFTEAAVAENWIHGPSTNPQNVLFGTDGGVYTAFNAGVAGQNIDVARGIYGSKVASVLASAVALNGGMIGIGGTTRSVGGLANVLNSLNTTVPVAPRNTLAEARGGMWYCEADCFFPTPTVAVAGELICAFGCGFNFAKAGTTPANGIDGLFGFGLAWSNGLPNNNWHLVAFDATGVPLATSQDTGISAPATNPVLRVEWGWNGSRVVIRGRINDVVVAEFTGFGKALSLAVAGATLDNLVGGVAGKVNAGQNGNQVDAWFGGYTGMRFGRMLA